MRQVLRALLLIAAILMSSVTPSSAAASRIYLASPLGFSEAGTYFKDTALKPELKRLGFEVIDPWELADPRQISSVQALPDGPQKREAWKNLDESIAKTNQEAINGADKVLAILDGSDVDSGTAAEIGYAFASKKPIVGYRGDFRLSSDNEGSLVNLQVEYFIRASGGTIVAELSQLKDALGQPQTKDAISEKTDVGNAMTTRSILDAFTIFPFAIVLAMALGEAFKHTVPDKDEVFVTWTKLYALAAFLFLILPFYQGMNKYLLVTYGELAKSPRPQAYFLVIDGIAFMIESALFFVMSRTLALANWRHFAWVVFTLLTVDSFWGLTVRLHAGGEAVIQGWTFLNLVTSICLLILIILGPRLRSAHTPAAILAVGMLVRTIVDYMLSWQFYFS